MLVAVNMGAKRMMRRRSPRRGAVAVLLAILLIPLIAFTAFCVDIGWTTSTKTELQNVADASAAAAARQLVDYYDDYTLANDSSKLDIVNRAKQKALEYALKYGRLNSAGGTDSISILPDDVEFGFIDAQGNYQANTQGFPNTVKVVARRDGTANGTLPFFFAPAIDIRDISLVSNSSSTIYSGLISGFDSKGGGDGFFFDDWYNYGDGYGSILLPVAFDVNHWLQFTNSGTSPDGEIHLACNGTPQIQVYPCPQNTPGNFGMLCIGAYSNANSEYEQWIANGSSDADLAALSENGCFPVSMDSPKPWKGTPGLRSELQEHFASIEGQTRLLPLFQPVSTEPYQAASGAGSNAQFNIVGFVGVVITQATGRGENMSICVQPSDVVDPTAVYDSSSIYPIGAEPSGRIRSFTHPSVRFTR